MKNKIPNLGNMNQRINADVVDIRKLFTILIDNRWVIIITSLVFAVIGATYALFVTPIYKADALIQVEQKSSGFPSFSGDTADLFRRESSATTEVEIIKSRMVLGETVDKLNLTTVVTPRYFPIVGRGIARLRGEDNRLDISRFDIPLSISNPYFTLKFSNVQEGSFQLLDADGKKILDGRVGQLAQQGEYKLFVTELVADKDCEFDIKKISKFNAVQQLQQNLTVNERGQNTGILQLAFFGSNPVKIQAVLNDISQNYFLQNVKRNAAEAEKSLGFLKSHLPEIKNELTKAEDKLNLYRQENESVDLNLEAKSTLATMVDLDRQLNELTFDESDIAQRFTKDHPTYVALLAKRQTLLDEKAKMNKRVEKLPKTQREILRLMRNVEVNQQIYVQLLNKVQELNIVRASTVGNVRILDKAQAYSAPVKPKKFSIVLFSTIIGSVLAVGFALLKTTFRHGIESPDSIEAIGLSVYACVPFSDWFVKAKKNKNNNLSCSDTLLALANPTDLAIEALRSFRTSLHFAMMDAKNNILMLSGPSPAVGKSFTSANLAAVITQSDKKVLLIDGDMRKGVLGKQLALSSQRGLSDYLLGQMSIDEIIKKDVGLKQFDFISRGSVPPNPSELLMHKRFKTLMDWASENYDLVIIDTPPLLAVTDAAIIATHTGTNILVARFARSTLREIEITLNRFKHNGIEIKGLILNGVVKTARDYYGYYE